MAQYYNRYTQFSINGQSQTVPFVSIPSKTTDKKVIYKLGKSRMDKYSEEYYSSPYFGWLIMAANPQYGGLEWNIPDGRILIIPYPLVASLQDYKQAVENHFFFYGR